MVFLSTLSLSALLLTVTSANPLRRATCNPNAQGAGVSIQSAGIPGLEWGIPAPSDNVVVGVSYYRGLSAPDWHIQQSGQFPTSYVIKDITTGMAVTLNGGEFTLDPANPTGVQPNQLFTITCDFCGTNVAPGNVLGEGCVISFPNVTGACIRIGPSAVDPLRNFGCETPSADEIYTIMT